MGEGELGQVPGRKKEWEYVNFEGYVSSESIAYSVGGGRGGGRWGRWAGMRWRPLKNI